VWLKKFPQLVAENRFFIWLSNVPARCRWGITSFLLIFIIFLWAIFIFRPILFQINERRNQVDAGKKQFILLQEHIGGKKRVKKESEEICDLLKGVVVGDREGIAKEILLLVRQSKNVCLKINRTTGAQPPANDSSEVAIRGTFFTALDFLNRLCQKKKWVKIKRFVCSRVGNGKVDVSLHIETVKKI
jgi:hypothetical protein